MRDGVIIHRTRRRRVSVRHEALPELVALLGMHLVWARRGLAAALDEMRLSPDLGREGQVRRWRTIAEAIETIIGRAADTFDEVEFELIRRHAEEEVTAVLTSPRPRGGRRLKVPANVDAIADTLWHRPDGPGDGGDGVPPGAKSALARRPRKGR